MAKENLSYSKAIGKIFSNFNSSTANMAAMGLVALILAMLLIPLPGFVLDVFMAINLGFSFILVLMVLMNRKTAELSRFPQFLLFITLFGLALNVSSTRLILTKGKNFDGSVVRAFANFVVGSEGNPLEGMVVGVIIFIILIAMQYFVVTKGATRVSEVAARFTLEAMPAKQMAVESEFNQGIIDEEEMKRRKKELQTESDFFGSMDGASKFISGNVMVGFLMTAVNIIGGLITGIAIKGYSAGDAISNYLILTIGDGLVSQFPSLLVSIAMGLMVTGAISDEPFGSETKRQLGKNYLVYYFAGLFFIILGFLKGFSFLVFWPVGAAFIYIGYKIYSSDKKALKESLKNKTESEPHPTTKADSTTVQPPDILQIGIGYGLIPLADPSAGGDLLDRISSVRQLIAKQLGLVVPDVHIVDNIDLEPTAYNIKIKDVVVGQGKIKRGHFMAIDLGAVIDEIDGEKTVDPTYGQPAIWIREDQRSDAERKGYEVVDGVNIIVTHLSEVIRLNGDELIGRQNVQSILDALKKDYPAVIEEVQKMNLGDIQKVLQSLLREGVSIRNMVPILETLADLASKPGEKDIGFMTDSVRMRLKKQIVSPWLDENGVLNVVALDPSLEMLISNSLTLPNVGGEIKVALNLTHKHRFDEAFKEVEESLVQTQGRTLPILTSGPVRRFVWQLVSPLDSNIPVFSVPEIPDGVPIVALGQISIEMESE